MFYRGPLKSNGSTDDKHSIRLAFHPQLEKLWQEEPLCGFPEYLTKATKENDIDILYTVDSVDYACLITDRLWLHAGLDILFLRPQPPGQIITTVGDIDNRLKTLFDGLRRPLDASELPHRASLLSKTPNPCHCVLSDDCLISQVAVTTDRLLDAKNPDEVVLIITVKALRRLVNMGNASYIE